MVDLVRLLLNHELQIKRMLSTSLTRKAVDLEPVRPMHGRTRKLTESEISSLIVRYDAGESTRQLAKAFDIHRTTIACHLTDNGVVLRRKSRKLTDELVREAAGRYAQGDTLAQLADRYCVGQETIRRELCQAGVKLRSRGGRR